MRYLPTFLSGLVPPWLVVLVSGSLAQHTCSQVLSARALLPAEQESGPMTLLLLLVLLILDLILSKITGNTQQKTETNERLVST